METKDDSGSGRFSQSAHSNRSDPYVLHQLLVAIDDTASAPVTLSFASALARGEGGIPARDPRQPGGGRRPGLHRAHRPTRPQPSSTAAVLQLLEVGVDATGSVSRSTSYSIGQVIAEAARSRQCDAIVLGSHRPTRRSRLAHPFGHGTRERIIRNSALPVITAPPPLQVPGGRPGRQRDGGPTIPLLLSGEVLRGHRHPPLGGRNARPVGARPVDGAEDRRFRRCSWRTGSPPGSTSR